MQKYVLFIFISVTSLFHSQNSIQRAIEHFSNEKNALNSSISFMVVNLENRDIIAKYNENQSIVSASAAKLFSTASAFEILGENYTTKTRIYIDGKIDSDSVLLGNLWIRGGGD